MLNKVAIRPDAALKPPARSAQPASARPYFPVPPAVKQNPIEVYLSVKKDRLRLATQEFYETELVKKNLVFVRMLWPLTAPGIKHILRDNAANYERPSFIRSTLSTIEGDGLLSATGARASSAQDRRRRFWTKKSVERP